MHFWVLQARFSSLKGLFGSTVPRKIGLNWFIPALANSKVGSLRGTTGLDFQLVWAFPSKNLMKVSLTLLAGHSSPFSTDPSAIFDCSPIFTAERAQKEDEEEEVVNLKPQNWEVLMKIEDGDGGERGDRVGVNGVIGRLRTMREKEDGQRLNPLA
uniref:Uncharacterized protein n=1 Tax=Opuntia streptacantha TaxID=393608 RepID=A0A7C9ARA9_OPUST